MDAKDWSLLRVAKRQRGVVTFEQARAVGFSRGSIRWRLAAGEWTRVLPSVVRLYWADDTWTTRCWAASLWAGRGAALSHVTAARLLGFDVAPTDLVHVTVCDSRGRPQGKWLRGHRARSLRQSVAVGEFQVTTAVRTAVDLAATLDSKEYERVLRVALLHGVVSSAALHDELSSLTGNLFVARVQKTLNRLVRV